MSRFPVDKAEILRALRFWTRLPVPVQSFEVDPHAAPQMNTLAPAAPVVGIVVGLITGLVLALGHSIGLPGLASAALATAAGALVTGAMHEDALADIADGFGGGADSERKLEIMKDPRLGSYGATALFLALVFRVAVLAAIVEGAGAVAAVVAAVGAAALARPAGLWPLVALDPARRDGSGAAAGRLDERVWRLSAAIGGGVGLVCALWVAGGWGLLAPVAGLAAAYGMAKLAESQIGGQTGDVCGAATHLAELAFLAVLVTTVHP